MERSGTSMVAGIIRRLGVYLGEDERLILETDYNVKGCYEHRTLLDISDRILKYFGGDNHTPPVFPPDWLKDPHIVELEAKAREIIEKEFRDKKIWGWKDTRVCITLPFWQKILPETVYVICVRNPVDVVNSLINRKWFSYPSYAYKVWLTYNVSVIEHTANKPRIFVFYEDFFADWRREVERIASFIEQISGHRIDNIEMDNFIDKGLQHHKTLLIDMLNKQDVPLDVKSLYLILRIFAKEQNQNIKAGYEDIKALDIIERLSHHIKNGGSASETLNLEAELERKDRQLRAILNSRSWRLTAPLRWIVRNISRTRD